MSPLTTLRVIAAKASKHSHGIAAAQSILVRAGTANTTAATALYLSRSVIISNPFSSSASDAVFKSSISLDKLYPNSNLNINKAIPIPDEKDPNKFGGYIPMSKIKITHCKSSGPGGQNVNVLNTKVDIRFYLESADWIPDPIRLNMLNRFRNVISKEGYFIVVSDRTRYQHLNTADALEKLREMIRSCEPVALAEPSPETLEKLRRQREKGARERLHQKRARSNTKSSRGAASIDY